MQIVPFGNPKNATGKPVEVIAISGEDRSFTVTILCQGEQHQITFKNGQIETLHNHTAEMIETELYCAEFNPHDLAAVPECIRVKIWRRDYGLMMIEDMI